MALGRILVVDDDNSLLELMRMRLESANYEVTATMKEEEAIEAAKGQVFDLSIVDLRLAQRDGISLMKELHLIIPDMPVIILTAHGSIESAVEAIKNGAFSYLTKPFEPQEMLFQIERVLENSRLASEIKRLKGLLKEKYDFPNIIAQSEGMQRVLEVVSRVAKTDSTVFINGESGTGKELIAKVIHVASSRKDKAFVAINLAAIPETLLESELFG
ncbi:MAG TPA: response regulator, partial [Thermodesulfobacteriota bacterium]|nr:response regulator [Thermodesulfobacteriota bacterium]